MISVNMGSKFWQFDKFPLYRGRPLNKGLRDRDLNVLVFSCCTCVAPTQSELTESEVITFLLFTSLVHVSMKLNHKYNVKSYINCLLQTKNGEPLPKDKWPSEDHWKRCYPELFPDSSSESEVKQEQVGLKRKVKRAIVFASGFLKNPFQFTGVIFFKKVILKTSLFARANLFC